MIKKLEELSKKQSFNTLLYTIIIVLTFMTSDWLYAEYNEYFSFQYTTKEFGKLFAIIMLISFIKSSPIRLTLYGLLVSFSFFQYVHFDYFGKNIAAVEFYLFATNINETFETFGSMLSIAIIPLVLTMSSFIIIFIVDSKIKGYITSYKYAFIIVLIGVLILLFKTFYITNMIEGKLTQSHSKYLYPVADRHSSRNFFVSATYFISGILPNKIFATQHNFPTLEKPLKRDNDEHNKTIILIIGESLRYDKFTLNDENILTPKLQSLKNDNNFYFKKVYSGGTMTKVSASVLINRLKYPNSLEQINNEENCLFKLAKENNISTSFISAQTKKNLQMIHDMICPKNIDYFFDRDDFKKFISPKGYDEDLVDMLKSQETILKTPFIVLQQRGSHSPYVSRYPKNFDKYSPYENTVLYTDNSLYNLITYLKNSIKNEYYIFYVSDHGELLGEDGKKGHGHLEKNVYEVPFLLYTNSKDSNIRDIFSHIKSHYDISNFITYLLGYQVDLYENNKERYIMNSDLDGFSGYAKVKFIDNNESSIEFFNHKILNNEEHL